MTQILERGTILETEVCQSLPRDYRNPFANYVAYNTRTHRMPAAAATRTSRRAVRSLTKRKPCTSSEGGHGI